MADIVNLRRARKAQERMRQKAVAGEARLKHGRSSAERALAQKEREMARTHLDNRKLENDGDARDD